MGVSVLGLIVRTGVGGGFVTTAAGFLRSVVGKACPCCASLGGATLYAVACPCYAFPDEVFTPGSPSDCSTPAGPCIYVDLRSVLADDPGTPLAQRVVGFWAYAGGVFGYYGPTIVVGGVCYRFAYPFWAGFFADPALSGADRLAAAEDLGLTEFAFDGLINDLPGGATTAGGNGVELPVSVGVEGEGGYSACSEEAGCAAWEAGADFFECFSCDGSALAQRFFVCARAAWKGNVIGDGAGTCLCIDRSVAYSAGAVAALELAAGTTLHTLDPVWATVWAWHSALPAREPMPSCCFCSGGGCLQGQWWVNHGDADKWFKVDVCCGPAAEVRYAVDLAYSRTLVSVIAPGDALTQTWGAVVTSLEDRVGGGTIVHVRITHRSVRPAASIDTTETSDVTVELTPSCCLPFSGLFPTAGTLTTDGSTFVDAYDGGSQPWYQLTYGSAGAGPPVIPDKAYNLRNAWNATPWPAGGAMPVASAGDPSDTYTGPGGPPSSVAGGPCATANFQLDEAFTGADGRSESVSINLTVTVVSTQGSPCGYTGHCGSGGWGAVDLGEMVP